jgi:MYXO-CTERM domain-containing protein
VPAPPAVAAERADAVFEARVEAVALDAASAETFGFVRYDLEVLRAWKGEVGPTAQLTTRNSGAACGRALTVGKVYIFYAGKREDGELIDSSCSRTRLSSTADEDLAVLGPGNSPLGGRTVTEPTTREPPRIAPPPPDLGGPPLVKQGCAVDPGPPTPLLVVCTLALWRRRPRKSRTV